MSDITVDTDKLRQYADRIDAVNRRLSNLDVRLDSLYTRVGLVGLWSLIQADALTGFSWRLLRCSSYLRQTASDFDGVEGRLLKTDPANYSSGLVSNTTWLSNLNGFWDDNTKRGQQTLRGILRGIIELGVSQSVFAPIVGDGTTEFWNKFWDGTLKNSDNGCVLPILFSDEDNYLQLLRGGYSVSGSPSYGKYKNKKILGDEDHLNINVDQKKIPHYQKNADEKWYKDPKATILEGKAEAKISGSVLEGQLKGSNDYAEGKISGKVLTGEAHATGTAGLYVYSKDKDGNITKYFSPGVAAEVGASVAAVQVDAEGRIGLGGDKKMLGAYGKVSGEALSAEAKGKVAVSAKEVYAGASAEANLVKATATAGVSVLGADVGVTGSVKVGVGAHAEVGWTDGKFKVDVGAAVGVGVDLGFEVDVSGTVDAVMGAATSVIDGIGGFFSGLF